MLKRLICLIALTALLAAPCRAEARPSAAELDEAFRQIEELIDAWRDDSGGAYLKSGSVNERDGIVEIELNGRNAKQLGDALKVSKWAGVLDLDYPDIDVSAPLFIPRAPETHASGDGFTLAMARAEYPVGARSVSFDILPEGGQMMDYELRFRLYKADGDEFILAPMDWLSPVVGTAVGETRLDFDLGCVRPLGEGLYRLSTGMGDLEFAVTSDAPPLNDAPEISPARFTVPEHELAYADWKRYNSSLDPNRAGDRLLAGDRLFWLHDARGSDIETDDDAAYSLLTAPANAPESVIRVYGPTNNALGSLLDAGDGLLFIEYIDTADEHRYLLRKLAYDGSSLTTVATRTKPVWGAQMIGDYLYYCDEHTVYRFDFDTHGETTVFTSGDDLESGFLCAGGQLIVPVIDWNDDVKGGVWAVDLQTLETRQLLEGKTYYLECDGERVYTLLCSEEPHRNIALSLDGTVTRLNAMDCLYEQLLPEGLLVRETGGDWGRSDSLTLFRPDGTAETGLPLGLFHLGGKYWIEDEFGNIARAALAG